MKINMKHLDKMTIEAEDSLGHKIRFDTSSANGGDDSAPTPMEMVLSSLGACSYMDMISILRKKRKTIDGFEIEIEGERAETHPKVFKKAHLNYILISPDADLADLVRAAELAYQKYCSVSAMLRASGCEITYSCKVIETN